MKLKKIIALCVIASFIAIPAAQAAGPGRPGPGPRPGGYGHRPPGPPPRHDYHRHRYRSSSDWWWIPGGILLGGLILGGLNNDGSAERERARLEEQQTREKKAQDIKSYCSEAVQKELAHALDDISVEGVGAYLEQTKKYWETKGMPPFLDDRPTFATLTVSGLQNDVKLEYKLLKD